MWFTLIYEDKFFTSVTTDCSFVVCNETGVMTISVPSVLNQEVVEKNMKSGVLATSLMIHPVVDIG